MKNLSLFTVSSAVVIFILSSSVEAGRTIKKPGAVLPKLTTPQPTITADDYETEQVESLPKAETITEVDSVENSTNLLQNSTETVEQKLERPQSGKRRKPCNHTSSAQVPMYQGPMHYRYPPSAYQYRLPPTMYQTYYRNRYRKQGVPAYGMTHSILPGLQKAATEMARGILSGMGWDTENWEMKLLENIVKLFSKDIQFLIQLFGK